MRRLFCLILLLLSFSLHSIASEGVSYKILQIASRVFYNSYKPVIKIAVNNGSQVNKSGSIVCRVERDNGEHVFDFEQDFSVAPLDSALLSFRFGLDKGFYKVSLLVDGKLEECVNMVYEPELVEYNIDSTLVPEIYYAKYFEQLKRLPLSVTSEKVKKTGAKERTAHKLVIKGVGGKMFEGYCLAPKKRGVYPVVITCTDRDEVLRLPEIDAYDDRIDLVISPRRAVIRNEAYYVGAYMDIIKTIDYVYGMKEADLKNIYLQGIGQGGAVALAVAALDKRVAAAAVYAPGYSNQNVLGETMLYEAKHLSGYIECPVMMGVGLEDKAVSASQSFEIYNPIKGNKEYYIFIEEHCPPAEWKAIVDNFYKKHQR